MTKRIILGGLVGAVLVFVVSSIWHLAGNLGEIGIKNMPGGGAVETAMRASIHDPGFYFFPPAPPMSGQPKDQATAAQRAYLEAYKQGPTGILLYSPGGTELQFAKLLLNQFLMNVVAGLLIAWNSRHRCRLDDVWQPGADRFARQHRLRSDLRFALLELVRIPDELHDRAHRELGD